MTYDSTALSLSADESSAYKVLTVAANTIALVGELRTYNDRLTAQALTDQETIANLTDSRNSLEITLAEVRQALADALARESALRIEYNETQAKLAEEQKLAGQHWDDLTATRTTLSHTEYNLAEVTIALDDTKAALTEAEGKLARFREILGLPNEAVARPTPTPIPTPVVDPEPLPNILHFSNPVTETIAESEAEPEAVNPLLSISGHRWES
jgi:chromosome segregation ATPase